MAKAVTARELLSAKDLFVSRHLGPSSDDLEAMLEVLGHDRIEALIEETVPPSIRAKQSLDVGPARSEQEVLEELHTLARRNQVMRSFIGMGYYGCFVPSVVQRNVLENPGWYTAYTPYQAEIAQGRLEALLIFQTMVSDLVGLPLANASLLDEGTAAAEAMALCHRLARGQRNRFLIADDCHPQTIAVVQGRAEGLGIDVVVAAPSRWTVDEGVCGALLQYPNTYGDVDDLGPIVEHLHASGALAVVATDLLAMTMLRPPGEFGADVVVGSSQRFGVPMGYGGPHAAFLATRDEFKRQVPGRVIGVSRDVRGRPALRMAMQTREQHIRREKATSNICTAQVLLAVMAAMYAVYHGPSGLRRIGARVHTATAVLAAGLTKLGYRVATRNFFDTIVVEAGRRGAEAILSAARRRGFNLRPVDDHRVGIALDETVGRSDIEGLLAAFADPSSPVPSVDDLTDDVAVGIDGIHERRSTFLNHPVFSSYGTEHEMLRFIRRLQSRDLSLDTSMISLGSCTMKLNATAEMIPVTWPEFSQLHPFAPVEQAGGYHAMMRQLERWLADVTGFKAVSMQPNAGAQGEYAGLRVISAYLKHQGQSHRDVCLIPVSAHGTNPASAVMAGLEVVIVDCDDQGNVDLDDLRRKAGEHRDRLAALMVTYPSTHGVFEASIRDVCSIVHEHGGQVYLDGANMNAQVGLCRPGDYGADVCHLNLHKTFCIPHGGGGPGMGPIAVAEHLAPFLPSHPVVATGGEHGIAPVSSGPWGSPSILPISWMYMAMMGSEGLTRATQVAILAANYMAKRLEKHYPILYRGARGRVAHEFIVDLRPFKKFGVEAEDVAKRLIDYGYHAPTMSFPVAGTLMIEPTESESRAELDRFCDALISIRSEIAAIERGEIAADASPLKHAPHTADMVMAEGWDRSYSREQAVYPAPWSREHKFWPHVGRVDNAWGDRHLETRCLESGD